MSSTPRRSPPSLAAAILRMRSARRSQSPSASSSRRRARRRPSRRGAGSGPLNRCVREDAVYNYGEMVDVGLINACTEPLVVFGCAQGTGKDRGRWICSDSEQRGDILVQIWRSTPRPALCGRQRRRHSHIHVPRQLLRHARAELAALVGCLRGGGCRVPFRWPTMDARRERPRRERRPASAQPDRSRELRLATSAHVRARVRRRHVERVELGFEHETRREAILAFQRPAARRMSEQPLGRSRRSQESDCNYGVGLANCGSRRVLAPL